MKCNHVIASRKSTIFEMSTGGFVCVECNQEWLPKDSLKEKCYCADSLYLRTQVCPIHRWPEEGGPTISETVSHTPKEENNEEGHTAKLANGGEINELEPTIVGGSRRYKAILAKSAKEDPPPFYTKSDIDERIDGILSYLGLPNFGHRGFHLTYEQLAKALNVLRKRFLPPKK